MKKSPGQRIALGFFNLLDNKPNVQIGFDGEYLNSDGKRVSG